MEDTIDEDGKGILPPTPPPVPRVVSFTGWFVCLLRQSYLTWNSQTSTCLYLQVLALKACAATCTQPSQASSHHCFHYCQPGSCFLEGSLIQLSSLGRSGSVRSEQGCRLFLDLSK